MRPSLPLYQIDAFADRPFTGNPAAVVLLDARLDDALLQAIAAENNLSETAFVVPEGEGPSESGAPAKRYHLRWFTPTLEVALCGHATLAAAWVLLESGGTADFRTQSGVLTVTRDGDRLTMDFPSISPVACDPPDGLLDALGVDALGAAPDAFFSIRSVHGANYSMAVFADAAQVAAMAPNTARLGRELNANVIVTAPGTTTGPGPSPDFVSRFFAPASGVPEDPVTGSAHCTLTPYWAARLGKTTLHGRQISRRGGDVFCELVGERVRLSGTCVQYLEGRIWLPA